MTNEDLESLYQKSEQVDSALFSEQKSNVRLVSGNHYNSHRSRYWERLRDNSALSNEQKIRLTKNHISVISKSYINNILTYSPDVKVTPNNETELQDQKAAELHEAVWQDIKKKNHFRKKKYQLAKDFIDIGEVAVKIFWNPNKGKVIGYRQEAGDRDWETAS